MAVLVEAVSVILRIAALERLASLAAGELALQIPNQSICQDRSLLRVGFMSGDDALTFAKYLSSLGLSNQGNTSADFAIVDQINGPSAPCDWLAVVTYKVPNGGSILAATLEEDRDMELSVPNGWEFEGSISQTQTASSTTEFNQRMEYLRTEENVEVYRDRSTGEEVFVGRTDKQRSH